jgi:hypothetical protein
MQSESDKNVTPQGVASYRNAQWLETGVMEPIASGRMS